MRVPLDMRAVAALAMLALIVAPSLSIATAGTGGGQDQAATAVSAYIARIELFINRTLLLAETYNVTIPAELEPLVNQSLTLIVEAKAALGQGDLSLALQLASEASSTFSSVAVYVWSSIPPEQREELRTVRVEAMVEARVRVAERLNATLQRLNETCGCLPQQVAERVRMLVEMAERARMALEDGNVTGAQRLVARFDVEAARTVRMTIGEMRGYVEGVRAAVAAVRGAVWALEAAADYINETIGFIESNETGAAVARLEAVVYRLENLGFMLQRIHAVAESQGANETYLAAIERLYNATVEAAFLVNTSISSLRGNDTASAVVYLTLAAETLYNATSEVWELDLPAKARAHIEEMEAAIHRLRARLAEAAGNIYARISIWVDNLLARLQNLLDLYEQGRVHEARVQAEFMRAKAQLERLLQALEGHAPQEVIQKIQDAITWIDENMPQGDRGRGGHYRP